MRTAMVSLAALGLVSGICAEAQNAPEDAHKFLKEALPRSEASYGSSKFTAYTGTGCLSTITFGKAKLAIDWSEITDTGWYATPEIFLVGRFDGASSISKRTFALKSADIAMRVITAVAALQRTCDPLKASGF